MTKDEFRTLHKDLRISVPKTPEMNHLPSATDPTQDIPVRMIQVNSLGEPMNVRQTKGVYSNLKPESFTSIEKRNNDKFDVLNELQNTVRDMSKKVTINPKKQKQNESKENN